MKNHFAIGMESIHFFIVFQSLLKFLRSWKIFNCLLKLLDYLPTSDYFFGWFLNLSGDAWKLVPASALEFPPVVVLRWPWSAVEQMWGSSMQRLHYAHWAIFLAPNAAFCNGTYFSLWQLPSQQTKDIICLLSGFHWWEVSIQFENHNVEGNQLCVSAFFPDPLSGMSLPFPRLSFTGIL